MSKATDMGAGTGNARDTGLQESASPDDQRRPWLANPETPNDRQASGQSYGATPYYGSHPHGDPDAGDGLLGSLDLFRLLHVLRKKWHVVLLVTIFFGIAAGAYLLTTPRVYRASSLMELSVRRPRIIAQQGAVLEDPTQASQSEEVFNTRLQKMKSQSMAVAAAGKYLAGKHGKYVGNADELWRTFKQTTRLTLLRKTRLVKIEFENTDPQLAADACNAFAEAAEADAYDENRRSSDSAVVWLQTQASAKRRELDKADQQLMKFREDNRVDLLDSRRKTVEQAMLDFTKEMVMVQSSESKAKHLMAALTATELTPNNAGNLPGETPKLEEIKVAAAKWSLAAGERDALLTRFTAKHPEVQVKEKTVEACRAEVVEVLKQARATAAANLSLLGDQAAGLQKKEADQRALASDLESQIVRLRTEISALERERNACDTSYRGILNRIEEARLSADENTATIKIVERASAPEHPVRPRSVLTMLLALILGLVAGSALAMVRDTLEDHVVGPEDIEAGMDIRTLACIPHVSHASRSTVATASMTHRFAQIAEAFAGLCFVLDSATYREHTKVTMVASALPEEGKTTTCCNLATMCARNGQRTLLIDFDLRRPRIAGILSMPAGKHGLLDYLVNGGMEIPDLVFPGGCPNLSVIASRPVHGASPAELIGGNRVADLIAWARANYDRVVVDAPPLGIVGDALVLAGLADCVLIMVRPGTSRKCTVRHTVQRFRDVGVSMIAAVMTDMDFAKIMHHGYGYGPYQHYQSHYKAYQPGSNAGLEKTVD